MAMQVVTGPASVQGTAEWLAFRQGTIGVPSQIKIGASETPAILGKSPWMTAYQLFRQKLGQIPPQKTNPAMLRGQRLEPQARAAYEALTGNIMVPLVGQSSITPFMIASLDGFDGFNKKAVEIKCPGDKSHAEALAGKVPVQYIDQLQHQMYVAEINEIDYYSYDGANGVLIKVPRDESRIQQIVVSVTEFWDRLQTGVWESDEWAARAALWLMANKGKEEATEFEASARASLLELVDEAEKKKEGGGVMVTLVERDGSVDNKALLAAIQSDYNITLPADYIEKFRKKGSKSWQIRAAKDADIEVASKATDMKHRVTEAIAPADCLII